MVAIKREGSVLTRRAFIRSALVAGVGAAIASACKPAAPAQAPTSAPAGQGTVAAPTALPPTAAPGATTVTMFESCWDGEHIAAGKLLYEQFRKDNPTINLVDRWPVGEDWNADLLSALAAGDQIDAVMWCASPFNFIDEGKIYDLKPLIDADTAFDKNDFYPEMTGVWTVDGKVYGWPYNYATTALYYNTKMFQAAGVEFPTLEWTWEDILAAAQKLTKDTGDPSTQKWGYLFRRVDIEHMVQSFGGNYVNGDEKRCDFTKPETIEGLQFFSDMLYKYKVSPQSAQMAGQDEVAMFASERVAMVGLPEWALLEFNRSHEKQGLEYDVTLMPKGRVGRKTRVRPSAVSIMKSTKDPKLAWEACKFVLSPGYEKKMQVEIPEAPPSRKSVNEYKWKESLTYPKSRELFLQQPSYGILPFYDMRHGNELADVIWPLLDLLMLGKETNMSVLAGKLCEEVNKKFAEI